MKNRTYYVLKTSRNKFLCRLNKHARTYSQDKAYKFFDLNEAIKSKHLAGTMSSIVRLPANIIIEIPIKEINNEK